MNPDDPKFTAHVLGEVDDLTPAERAEIEALLASDPAAAAEAEEMRTLGARLRTGLHAEEGQPLREEQRAEVLKTVTEPASAAAKIVRFPRRATVLSAIAACLVVGVSLALLFPAMLAEKEAARKSLITNASITNRNDSGSALSDLNVAMPVLEPAPLPQEAPEPRLAAATTANPAVPVFNSPDAPVAPQAPLALNGSKFNLASVSPPTPTVSAISTTNLSTPTFQVAAATPTAKTAPSDIPSKLPNFTSGWAKGGTSRMSAANPSGGAEQAAYADAPSAKPARRAAVAGGKGLYASVDEIDRSVMRRDGTEDLTRRMPAPFALEPQPREPANTESFDAITDNAFLSVRETPLSTFSIDVDTASYAIVRRFLNENQRPPKGAVRIEELLNYFTYDYPQPQGDAPFSATMEVATCPWTPEHRLVRIGLKGREIAKDKRPASNLVFLIDVSGSMNMPIKLPLLKQSLGLLIDQLGAEDQVAMVVYAGNSGCVLEPTHDKAKMRAALKKLEAGGSTNGASGIALAYQLAERHFIKGGTNRVILATDGDWNVGVTNQSELLEMIARKARSGVFLTVLGYGMDNLNDSMLVKLADKGNGNYAYIDTLIEAKKVLVDQLSGTLVTIAKDVKIQVEFNPAQVAAYRLIGYEKRLLAKEDFNDDKKDAGEIGAGHTVTALYEIVPAGKALPGIASVDVLKYQPRPSTAPEPRPTLAPTDAPASGELLTLKLRYKAPDGDTSKLLEFPLTDAGETWEKSTHDFRFAAAVASYGMLLRDSPHKGQATWNSTLELASEGKGEDASGYRGEFMALIEKAKALGR